VVEVDRDNLAGVGEADLDVLPGDLNAAAAGDLPLDGLGLWREWVWPGEADALELVPLAWRDRAGQSAPQDAVLGDDVHDLAVEPDPGPLAGQRGADLDDLVAERDDPGGVDQPLHFHAAGRGQGTRRWPGRRRPGRTGTSVAEPREVDCGQPGRHGLDPPSADAHVHGGGVDPEGELLADPAGAQPELLRPDRHVPRDRDDPLDLDGIRPAHGIRRGQFRSRSWHSSGDRLEVSRSPQRQAVISGS
jgi:hypothetical protein